MLKAGASVVYYAKVTDNSLDKAFEVIMKLTSPLKDNQKDIKSLLNLPHVEFNMNYLELNKEIPISFKDGKWISMQNGN